MSAAAIPLRADLETVSAKLSLFGTIVGLMGDKPEIFGDDDYYALEMLLYETSKEVCPHTEDG